MGGRATQVTAGVGQPAIGEEDALVLRAQQGDRVAFELLVAPRLRRLLRLTASIVSNEADASDAVQEACLRAWRELPRLRDTDRFEAWLWQIAVNACRSALRSRRRMQVREIDVESAIEGAHLVNPKPPFDDGVSEVDLVRRAFRRLDPDKRTILVLHHVEERSIADIADLLAIPEGTAKWRLFSARKALTQALEVERR